MPNKNNQIYLYTSKNDLTKWNLVFDFNTQHYNLIFAGKKFDVKKQQIVICRYVENYLWAINYQDIVILYNKNKLDLIKGPIKNEYIPNTGRES